MLYSIISTVLTLRHHNVNFDNEGVSAGSWHPTYPSLKFYEEIAFDTFERLKSTHRENVLS